MNCKVLVSQKWIDVVIHFMIGMPIKHA